MKKIATLFALMTITWLLLIHPAFSATPIEAAKIVRWSIQPHGAECNSPASEAYRMSLVRVEIWLQDHATLSDHSIAKQLLLQGRELALKKCNMYRKMSHQVQLEVFLYGPQNFQLSVYAHFVPGRPTIYRNGFAGQIQAEKQDRANANRRAEQIRTILSQYPNLDEDFVDSQCVFWGLTPKQCWDKFRLYNPRYR